MNRTALIVLSFFAAVQALALDARQEIVLQAQKHVGSTYLAGGTAPSQFDCSGFVGYVLKAYVPGLPRTSLEMSQTGTKIKRDDLAPGDLVFFTTTPKAGVVSHVALYIGQDSLIHAISDGPTRGVAITPLGAKYWSEHFFSAVRVLPPAVAPTVATKPVVTTTPIQYAKGTYTGELKAGEPNGKGTLKLANGDLYVGNFTAGQLNGAGTYTWKSGETFSGEFQNNGAKPAANTKPIKKTSLETKDSVWDTWEGFLAGDYGLWLTKESDDFEAWKKANQP